MVPRRPHKLPDPAPGTYAYTDPDAQVIGQGATGNLDEYPECPLCLAHGGGGHGSNCPNAGKDPADWLSLPPDGWTAPGRAA